MESYILQVSCKVKVKPKWLHLLCKRPEAFMIQWTFQKSNSFLKYTYSAGQWWTFNQSLGQLFVSVVRTLVLYWSRGVSIPSQWRRNSFSYALHLLRHNYIMIMRALTRENPSSRDCEQKRRIPACTDWSVPLLFSYWKVSYLNLFPANLQYSS